MSTKSDSNPTRKRVIRKKRKPAKKKKTGRPKIKIDEDKLVELSEAGCSIEESAAVLDVSKSTLIRHIRKGKGAADWARGSGRGKAKLRSAMLSSALLGNATMMIWLSKVWLGLKEPGRLVQIRPPDPAKAPEEATTIDGEHSIIDPARLSKDEQSELERLLEKAATPIARD